MTPLIVPGMNDGLYNELRGKFDLARLDPDGTDHWSVDLMGVTPIIYAGVHEDHAPSFTHELLHVKYCRDPYWDPPIWIPRILSGKAKTVSQAFTSSEFITFIAGSFNIMMHPLMLNEFTGMGFSITDYVFDYNELIEDIDNVGDFNIADVTNVHFGKLCRFIHFCCAIKFHPNPAYTKQGWELYIAKYGTEYSKLYDPINALCDEWMAKAIANNGIFFERIIDVVENWASHKTYTNYKPVPNYH